MLRFIPLHKLSTQKISSDCIFQGTLKQTCMSGPVLFWVNFHLIYIFQILCLLTLCLLSYLEYFKLFLCHNPIYFSRSQMIPFLIFCIFLPNIFRISFKNLKNCVNILSFSLKFIKAKDYVYFIFLPITYLSYLLHFPTRAL